MILIYPHAPYSTTDGGITVLYYLASLLKKKNINVKIYKKDINKYAIENSIFTEYTSTFDVDNTIVIYCEGTFGNPLNAKYIIRYILSELGKNVSKDIYLSWNKNDLCYYYL